MTFRAARALLSAMRKAFPPLSRSTDRSTPDPDLRLLYQHALLRYQLYALLLRLGILYDRQEPRPSAGAQALERFKRLQQAHGKELRQVAPGSRVRRSAWMLRKELDARTHGGGRH